MVGELTETEKDFLKEMANIATGNASTLLSKKIGQEIKLSVPLYKLISPPGGEFERVPKGIAVCAFAKLKGDVLGNVVLVFSRESAFRLADLLLKKKIGTTEWLSERDQEELLQMGNSVLQCYLKAMSGFVDIDMGLEELRMFSTIGDAIMDLLNLAEPYEGPILVLRNELAIQKLVKAKVSFHLFLRIKDALSLLRKAGLG